MIEMWAFPVSVLIGYILILLFDEPTNEVAGFVSGVWIMYGLSIILR